MDFNTFGKTNLLKSVKRPLGATISISYERTGNTYEVPHSKWVMNKVTVFDGLIGDTPAPDSALGDDYQVTRGDIQLDVYFPKLVQTDKRFYEYHLLWVLLPCSKTENHYGLKREQSVQKTGRGYRL